MKLFGLTGGIGSGKTTVAGLFRAQGAHVLDADAIYADLVTPRDGHASPLVCAIDAAIPGSILADGNLDRESLRRKVFSDATLRATLNAITHPAVGAQCAAALRELIERGVTHVIYDVPLLYETGLHTRNAHGFAMSGVIVVWVPRQVQLKRLQQRDGLTLGQAEERLSAQMPLDEKKKLANWVIDNSGSLQQTEQAVRELWAVLTSPLAT